MPEDDHTADSSRRTIVAASYLALAIGRVPGLAIDRAGVALVGACLMVGCGALPLRDAYSAIDLDTITLLLGMMIVVANLRLSGFFALANAWVIGRAHRPLALLAAVTLVSGVFSAFLVNDAVCLVLTPLVLELTLNLKRNPVPYLLAVAMASNVGSTATITGNPQNIMIGSFSRIPYATFAAALAPIAASGPGVDDRPHRPAAPGRVWKGRTAASGGRPHPRPPRDGAACSAGHRRYARTLLCRPAACEGRDYRRRASAPHSAGEERPHLCRDRLVPAADVRRFVYHRCRRPTTLLTPDMVATVSRMRLQQVPVLSAVTAVLSNLVSNVPAVLMLKPFIEHLPNRDTAWLAVAMASTLAGNFTVLGSIANLIVVEKAARRGVTVGFWDYFRVGGPLAVLTIVVGTLWLMR